jgi:hypothetical protein
MAGYDMRELVSIVNEKKSGQFSAISLQQTAKY